MGILIIDGENIGREILGPRNFDRRAISRTATNFVQLSPRALFSGITFEC